MAESIRWGILGTGGIAHAFASDLRDNGFTIAAVGSRSQESADAFAAEFGIPTAHPTYEALAADPGVDAIYVSTPHPFHAENATLALNGGKHVLVEKPFTLNQGEATAVVALAAEKRLVVLEAMWSRFLPHMVRLREIIAEGTIGQVRTVIADHNQNLPKDPSHRLQNPDLGGGALLDLGIYPVSFAWDMLGAPTSVNAISSPTATGVDRQTAIVLGYENGQQALLHTALDTAGPNEASVIGTNGWVKLDGTFYVPTTFTVRDSSNEVVETFEQEVGSRGMQFQAWELERLVAAGEIAGEILPPEETVGIMGTLDEVRRIIGLKYPGE
ncbi:Gfo/Idh/MocA family oxidoreductase [Glaciihabitans arcticus]|uniref:Gfo/Idh/MocA family oxidoreductase n=1 Tax=Glaciihabitans arcticus TaxID=2668039 RepID=A0A4Q9GRI3_9MICO|nr:Gfo/Idh/MocA family oxidoreductase [Glaciihabitans arcticus]TBN55404.1 Gfo/Idh/MocA family oxidoreductase [Glaciihabitans arcticus]